MKITFVWNDEESPETTMMLPKDFYEHARITRLDFLQDAISLLERKYNEEIDNFTVERA